MLHEAQFSVLHTGTVVVSLLHSIPNRSEHAVLVILHMRELDNDEDWYLLVVVIPMVLFVLRTVRAIEGVSHSLHQYFALPPWPEEQSAVAT